MKFVNIKVIRVLKFRQQTEFSQKLKDPLLKFVIYEQTYPGADPESADQRYRNQVMVDLASVFKLKRYEMAVQNRDGMTDQNFKSETV